MTLSKHLIFTFYSLPELFAKIFSQLLFWNYEDKETKLTKLLENKDAKGIINLVEKDNNILRAFSKPVKIFDLFYNSEVDVTDEELRIITNALLKNLVFTNYFLSKSFAEYYPTEHDIKEYKSLPKGEDKDFFIALILADENLDPDKKMILFDEINSLDKNHVCRLFLERFIDRNYWEIYGMSSQGYTENVEKRCLNFLKLVKGFDSEKKSRVEEWLYNTECMAVRWLEHLLKTSQNIPDEKMSFLDPKEENSRDQYYSRYFFLNGTEHKYLKLIAQNLQSGQEEEQSLSLLRKICQNTDATSLLYNYLATLVINLTRSEKFGSIESMLLVYVNNKEDKNKVAFVKNILEKIAASSDISPANTLNLYKIIIKDPYLAKNEDISKMILDDINKKMSDISEGKDKNPPQMIKAFFELIISSIDLDNDSNNFAVKLAKDNKYLALENFIDYVEPLNPKRPPKLNRLLEIINDLLEECQPEEDEKLKKFFDRMVKFGESKSVFPDLDSHSSYIYTSVALVKRYTKKINPNYDSFHLLKIVHQQAKTNKENEDSLNAAKKKFFEKLFSMIRVFVENKNYVTANKFLTLLSDQEGQEFIKKEIECYIQSYNGKTGGEIAYSFTKIDFLLKECIDISVRSKNLQILANIYSQLLEKIDQIEIVFVPERQIHDHVFRLLNNFEPKNLNENHTDLGNIAYKLLEIATSNLKTDESRIKLMAFLLANYRTRESSFLDELSSSLGLVPNPSQGLFKQENFKNLLLYINTSMILAHPGNQDIPGFFRKFFEENIKIYQDEGNITFLACNYHIFLENSLNRFNAKAKYELGFFEIDSIICKIFSYEMANNKNLDEETRSVLKESSLKFFKHICNLLRQEPNLALNSDGKPVLENLYRLLIIYIINDNQELSKALFNDLITISFEVQDNFMMFFQSLYESEENIENLLYGSSISCTATSNESSDLQKSNSDLKNKIGNHIAINFPISYLYVKLRSAISLDKNKKNDLSEKFSLKFFIENLNSLTIGLPDLINNLSPSGKPLKRLSPDRSDEFQILFDHIMQDYQKKEGKDFKIDIGTINNYTIPIALNIICYYGSTHSVKILLSLESKLSFARNSIKNNPDLEHFIESAFHSYVDSINKNHDRRKIAEENFLLSIERFNSFMSKEEYMSKGEKIGHLKTKLELFNRFNHKLTQLQFLSTTSQGILFQEGPSQVIISDGFSIEPTIEFLRNCIRFSQVELGTSMTPYQAKSGYSFRCLH